MQVSCVPVEPLQSRVLHQFGLARRYRYDQIVDNDSVAVLHCRSPVESLVLG